RLHGIGCVCDHITCAGAFATRIVTVVCLNANAIDRDRYADRSTAAAHWICSWDACRLPGQAQSGDCSAKARPQCIRLDPGAALRPQTAQSFDCLDAASPSRIHSSACLRSISRAKGSSVFSAAWRQSLAWCSHNSTCDDIGQLVWTPNASMNAVAQSGLAAIGCCLCPLVAQSDECVQSRTSRLL